MGVAGTVAIDETVQKLCRFRERVAVGCWRHSVSRQVCDLGCDRLANFRRFDLSELIEGETPAVLVRWIVQSSQGDAAVLFPWREFLNRRHKHLSHAKFNLAAVLKQYSFFMNPTIFSISAGLSGSISVAARRLIRRVL